MQIAPDGPMPDPDWQQFAVAVHVVPTASHELLLLLLLPLSLFVVPLSFPAWFGSMQRPSEHTRDPLQSLSDAHRSATDVAQAIAPSPTNATTIHVFPLTRASFRLKTDGGERCRRKSSSSFEGSALELPS
jgi:hypothetical protein